MLLKRNLSDATANVASALLLGRRSDLDENSRDLFIRTGTLHLFAISGLHVGILASPWLLLVRAGILPRRATLLAVMLLTFTYAGLVENRSPVVRASIIIHCLCLSWITRRRPSWGNSLGMAGCIVLWRNPLDLFAAGTQLSFLAVAVLGRSVGPKSGESGPTPLERLIWQSRSRASRAVRRIITSVCRLLWTSTCVWLATAPLVVGSFHVLAPVAVPLNLVVCFPLTVGLLAGVVVVAFSDILAPIADLAAAICDGSLRVLLASVRAAEQLPGSHFWLAGPPWFVAPIFYGILLLTVIFARRKGMKWIGFIAAASFYSGACIMPRALPNPSIDRLTCTMIAVGHGTCVALELPNGKVWLYDAGSRGDPRRGADRVARALWSMGINRIDTVVVSHSDVDHYNLVPDLAERFKIRRVVTGPDGWNLANRSERWFVRRLSQQRLTTQFAMAGHCWSVGPDARISVLQPTDKTTKVTDNARSVVLLIQLGKSSILLPGDLEGEGIDELLGSHSCRVDVAMAPHHGSPQSDPASFLQWCRPRWCVISSGRSRIAPVWHDAAVATSTVVMNTARDGAIRFQLTRQNVSVQTFLSDDRLTRRRPTKFDSPVQPSTADD